MRMWSRWEEEGGAMTSQVEGERDGFSKRLVFRGATRQGKAPELLNAGLLGSEPQFHLEKHATDLPTVCLRIQA